MMEVTAIVPTYNAEPYIEETLNSLMQQTLPLREIIVVDDCSTDQTLAIVQRLSQLDTRIAIERNESNKGVSYSRNKALRRAGTDWVLFMDADDTANPELLREAEARHAALTQQYPSESWILLYPAYQQMDENGLPISGEIRSAQVMPDEIFGYEILRNQIITPSGVLLRREDALAFGGFDETRKYDEDWDLWLKLAKKGGFGYIDQPLVNVRRHPTNTTSQMSKTARAEYEVLSQYSLPILKNAIEARHLPRQTNLVDYVSLLFRLDRWEEGYRELMSLKDEDSRTSSYYFHLGLYHLQSGNLEEAGKAFRSTLKLHSEHGAALNNLGIIEALQGRGVQAQALFEQAVALFPGYIDATHNLAVLAKDNPKQMLSDYRTTGRELRKVLLKYTS
jgi:glycosyltransferase involved in cell wall biosynthesis